VSLGWHPVCQHDLLVRQIMASDIVESRWSIGNDSDEQDDNTGRDPFQTLAFRLEALAEAQERAKDQLAAFTSEQHAAKGSLDELTRQIGGMYDMLNRFCNSVNSQQLDDMVETKAEPGHTPSRMAGASLGVSFSHAVGSVLEDPRRDKSVMSVASGKADRNLDRTGSVASCMLGEAVDRTTSAPNALDMRDFLNTPQEPLSQLVSADQIFAMVLDEDVVTATLSKGMDLSSEIRGSRSKSMINPHCRSRMIHDLFSVVVLFWDVMGIPMFLAWEVQMEGWLRIMAILSWTFWLWDIGLTFCTGVYIGGELTMQRTSVARKYITTWFLPDLLVVIVDAASIVTGLNGDASGSSSTGLLRMSKMGRFLRLARLLRLARVSEIVTRIVELNSSNFADMLLDIVKPLLAIIVVNHLLACLWFGVGRLAPSDTGLGWLDVLVNEESGLTYREASALYQYSTSIHWSMTQMTPGSMQVFPQNTWERSINCICLLVGMMAFSSIISSLSAKLVQSQARTREKTQKLSQLRRFLRKKGVHPRFAVLVERTAVEAMSNLSQKPVVCKDVAAVLLLPTSLQQKLKNELSSKHLQHPLFRSWYIIDPDGIPALCNEAVDSVSLAAGDVLFWSHTEAEHAYYVIEGSLSYSIADHDEPQESDVGAFLCEAALWAKWTHVGEAIANGGSECMTINAVSFGKIVTRQRLFAYLAIEYGKLFYSKLVELKTTAGRSDRPTDIQVPFTSLDIILPTMPLECRLLVGASALKAAKAKHHRWYNNMLDEKFDDEVRDGKCCLMINVQGEMERIVAIQVLAIMNEEKKILTEVGKWTGEKIVIDVKLPGKKQAGGESSESTLQRVMRDTLAPIAEHVRPTGFELEETSNLSKRTLVTTKYLRTVNYCKYESQVELVNVGYTRQTTGVGRNGRRNSRSSFGTSLAAVAGDAFAGQVQGNLQMDTFALADPKGTIFLYAWLDNSEREFYRSTPGEEILQRHFDGIRVDVATERLARERYNLAKQVARDKWEMV